jgi:hypothetical protein
MSMAQVPNVTKFRLTAGYGWSGNFDDKNGKSVTVQGPVLGLEYPLVSAFRFDSALGVSWFGGGRLRSGGDADADVWRFMALARTEVPGTGIFAKGGLGYSLLKGRGNVGDDKGAILQLGVEIPIAKGYAQRVVPQIDIYYVAGKSGLSGFVVGLTGSF